MGRGRLLADVDMFYIKRFGHPVEAFSSLLVAFTSTRGTFGLPSRVKLFTTEGWPKHLASNRPRDISSIAISNRFVTRLMQCALQQTEPTTYNLSRHS